MTGRLLLDTNAVIAIFADHAPIHQLLAAASDVYVPVVVLGELYYGANKSSRAAANIARIDGFIETCEPPPCDPLTAQYYGRIKNLLRAKGRPIPESDIWIAALAQQHDLSVTTRDGHFGAVDGLTTVSW